MNAKPNLIVRNNVLLDKRVVNPKDTIFVNLSFFCNSPNAYVNAEQSKKEEAKGRLEVRPTPC